MTKRLAGEQSSNAKSLLDRFAFNKGGESKNILSKYTANTAKQEEEKDVDENVNAKLIPVNRKNRNNLKNIEELPKNNLVITNSNSDKYNDLPLTGAVKQTKKPNSDMKMEVDDNTQKLVEYDSDDAVDDVKFEAFLFKITNSKKLKKLWFKLIGKDLYCINIIT